MQRSLKRYHCFISFHGGERLDDLGFIGPGIEGTVRDLTKDVSERLRDFGVRHPSVFYRQTEIDATYPKSIPDELPQALLHLRGGGVVLVLLSHNYLRTALCLAGLGAILELERLRNDKHWSGEAIEFCVVFFKMSMNSETRSTVLS